MPDPVTTSRLAYRFVTGLELDGVKRTNATWRRPGRQVIDDEGVVWRWHFLPRSQRALWRVGGTGMLALLGWFGWYEPAATWQAVQGVMVLGLLVAAHWFWTWLKDAEIKHRYVGPLAEVLASRFGITPPTDPTSWITVHPDSRTNSERPVEVLLPADYRESDRQMEQTAKHIARKVRIPVKAMDYELDAVGDHPKLLVRAQEVPPEVVDFDMARPYLEQASDERLFLGIGLRNTPVWGDLALDSPHWATSFGSGGGKSTFCRMIAAQVRRQDPTNRIVIFDFAKEGDSHADWVYDSSGNLLPGVELHIDVDAAHMALEELADERARRSRVAHQAKRFGREAPKFPRILIIFEELNTSIPMLVDYWKRMRESDDPTESPAMRAYASLVCTGRATRMNMLAVAQRFDAKVAAGGDTRANFMVRILSRFDEQARRMLIPEITDPKPRSSNHPGRMLLALAGVATTFQGVYMTPDEARDWAMGGDSQSSITSPVRATDQQEQATESPEDPWLPESTPTLALPPAADPEPDLVTLPEALERGLVSGTKDALSWHARQDGFPTPRGKGGKRNTANLYEAHELAEWEERRTRRPVMSR